MHLSRGGAEVQIFAPDVPQMHVIDHTKGQPSESESRWGWDWNLLLVHLPRCSFFCWLSLNQVVGASECPLSSCAQAVLEVMLLRFSSAFLPVLTGVKISTVSLPTE